MREGADSVGGCAVSFPCSRASSCSRSPAAAHGYTFYEWDTAAPPRGIGIVGDTLHFGLPSGQLGQSTLRGVQTSVAVAGGTTASAFAPAANGTDLWFLDDGADKVGRITPGAPPVLLTNALPLPERSHSPTPTATCGWRT